MTGHYVPVEKQCFFKSCKEASLYAIEWRGKMINVCHTHFTQFHSSYEKKRRD